jgi:2-amino-4-hydroxy-6-hydroxymethyldihydropteridine diphosphokinase
MLGPGNRPARVRAGALPASWSPELTTAWLALGSNLGDRDAALAFAVAALDARDETRVLECSSVYETDPVGPGEQDAYLNAVVRIETELSPHGLLQKTREIERRAGREPEDQRRRWGARTLDIDILFFGDARIDEPDLVVPHPRIAERAFVLVPLAAIDPDLVHPVLGRTAADLLEAVPRASGEGLPPGIRAWERCLRIGPDASSRGPA